MSDTESDLDAIREIYLAFSRGDIDAVLERFDEEIAWIGQEGYFVPSGRGETVGRAAVMGILREYAKYWAEFELEPEEMFSGGPGIVFVIGRQIGHSRKTGDKYVGSFANFWRVREGKVLELRGFSDTKSLHEAITGVQLKD